MSSASDKDKTDIEKKGSVADMNARAARSDERVTSEIVQQMPLMRRQTDAPDADETERVSP